MPAKRKSTKGAFYSKSKVKEILAKGKPRRGPMKTSKPCWAVDIESMLLAASRLSAQGKKVMRIFVTEDVPGRSPGKVIDPATHMLFIETVQNGAAGCMEQFPPAGYVEP